MSSTSPFTVTKPNDTQIENFYTWAMNAASVVSNPIFKNVFYTHDCINYVNQIQNISDVLRKNACGDVPFTGGSTRNDPLPIRNNEPIFLPLMHTFMSDNEVDENGNRLDQAVINGILDHENGLVRKEDLNASIQDLAVGGPQPLAPDLTEFLSEVVTFSLTIPADSALADKVEFAQPKGVTLNVRAQGYFALISNIPRGLYRIISNGFGVRNYKAFIDYFVEVT